MHRVAEYGVAAHFDYKLDDVEKERKTDTNDVKYLKKREECLQRNKPKEIEVENVVKPSKNFWFDLFFEDFDASMREGIRRKRDETFAPYIEALDEIRMDIAREKVIVMITAEEKNGKKGAGTIISLPSGSRVLDALRVGKRKEMFDISLSGADDPFVYRNGMLIGITEELHCGDKLVVPVMEN